MLYSYHPRISVKYTPDLTRNDFGQGIDPHGQCPGLSDDVSCVQYIDTLVIGFRPKFSQQRPLEQHESAKENREISRRGGIAARTPWPEFDKTVRSHHCGIAMRHLAVLF